VASAEDSVYREAVDYQNNLDVVDKFPFSLYHRPIQNETLRTIKAESFRGPLTILNVGCGLSQILRRIAPEHEVYGVDIDERNIEASRLAFPQFAERFQLCSANSLDFPDSTFDVVFATEVIEHVLDTQKWLAELARVLKPGGRLHVSTPNYGDYTLPLVECTFLEWVARRKGFTRVGLHPNPFTATRLRQVLQEAGYSEVQVSKTPGWLALNGVGRKPLQLEGSLQSSTIQSIFANLTRHIPVSLAAREVMRMATLLPKLRPGLEILDVGCGDGSFWRACPSIEGFSIDGMDINSTELDCARNLGVFRHLDLSDISSVVPTHRYDLAVGNCSLEHIPDINSALVNIRKALRPDGTLMLYVPAFGWTKSLALVRLAHRVGQRLGMSASGMIDGFFQHHHLYDQRSWTYLVERAGYQIVQVGGLGSPAINSTFEKNLSLAFLEFVHKSLTRRYSNFLAPRRLPTAAFFEEVLSLPVEPENPAVVEYLIEAQPLGT
jgi:2-polyprenyl-3-methyl-5-hydroxy-6-metoxy-1,4-benzoquinol methylase